MESQVNEISPIMVEVSVQVPWDRVQKDLDAGYRVVARTARVRGFRPGKVPRHMLKRLFGKQVKAEVSSTLVEAGLLHAVETHELAVVAEPTVDMGDIADGKPFEFKAKVEVRPRLDEVDLSNLKIYQTPIDIANEAVDGAILDLRKEHADVREPDPMRPARNDDEVTADYTVFIDGELNETLSANDRVIDLTEEALRTELRDGFVGMSPGDEKTVEIEFDADHPNKDLAGKKADFNLKLVALRERILPDEDDDFAQDCGEYETLLDLRADIRKKLTEKAEKAQEASIDERLIEQVMKHNDVPIPPGMLKQQKQAMVQRLVQFMQMGADSSFLDAALADIDERAERQVKTGLLLGAIARLEKLEIGEEQIEEKLLEIANETGKHIAKVRVEYSSEERRQQLENAVLEEKLMAFLRSKATIVEGEPPEQDDEPAAEAKKSESSKPKSEKSEAGEPADDDE